MSKKDFVSDQGNNNSSIVNEHLKLKIRTVQNAPNILVTGELSSIHYFTE